jgi:hypothetical protein
MQNEQWLVALLTIGELKASDTTGVAKVQGAAAKAYQVPDGWEPIGCVPDMNGLTLVIRKRRA